MPMPNRRMVALEYLRARLHYDPSTGVFTWRAREVHSVQDMRWNAKFSGKVAGTKCGQGYIIIAIDNVQYRAHRLAWLYVNGEMPNDHIDHYDEDRSNNRISNLRRATHAQNLWNRGAPKHSKTGVKGVFKEKKGTYRAEICANGRRRYIGRFKTLEDASAAYAEAARIYHGDFANTSPPCQTVDTVDA